MAKNRLDAYVKDIFHIRMDNNIVLPRICRFKHFSVRCVGILLCCIVYSFTSIGRDEKLLVDDIVLHITSQDDFNMLSANLRTLSTEKTPIKVIFDKGIYYFNDSNEIQLDGCKSDIIFIGSKETYFISDGENYSKRDAVEIKNGFYKIPLKSRINADYIFIDNQKRQISLSDSGWLNEKYNTNIVNSPIEISDSVQRIARILIPNELKFLKNQDSVYFKNSRICYKAQWTDCYRRILCSDSTFIYFELSEHLLKRFKDYVGNMFAWVKKGSSGGEGYSPFYITNIKEAAHGSSLFYDDNYLYFPLSISAVHVCQYKKFMTIENSQGKVKMVNMNFCGSATGDQITSYNEISPVNYRMDLILFSRSKYLEVSNCKFRLMGGGAVHMHSSQYLKMKDNTFVDNYTDLVANFSGENGVLSFQKNYIHNPSKLLTHITCLYLDKVSDADVSSNVAIDVSRGFLKCRRGQHFRIDGNEIYNTKEFNEFPVRNLSSDGGALVYASTNTPMYLINNIVHDLPANYRYNGIYLDGGSGNAQIRNNLFYNIAEDAIYSRRVVSNSKSGRNNILDGNIILGNSVYAGCDIYDDDNACLLGNYLPSKVYKSIVNNKATDKGGNISVDTWKVENGCILLPNGIYKRIKRDSRYSRKIKSRLNKF